MPELSVIAGRNDGNDSKRSPLASDELAGKRVQSPDCGSNRSRTSRLGEV